MATAIKAATSKVQIEWHSAIDEIAFFENEGLLNFEVVGKAINGVWLINLEFANYKSLSLFMITKYGVIASDIESYMIPA